MLMRRVKYIEPSYIHRDVLALYCSWTRIYAKGLFLEISLSEQLCFYIHNVLRVLSYDQKNKTIYLMPFNILLIILFYKAVITATINYHLLTTTTNVT